MTRTPAPPCDAIHITPRQDLMIDMSRSTRARPTVLAAAVAALTLGAASASAQRGGWVKQTVSERVADGAESSSTSS